MKAPTFWNNKAPLWLPPGSVRDIVFMLVMGTTCALAWRGNITPGDFLKIALGVMGVLIGAKIAQPPANGGTP